MQCCDGASEQYDCLIQKGVNLMNSWGMMGLLEATMTSITVHIINK